MSFNTTIGLGDPRTLRPIYIPGKGKMIRRSEVQNTRIAALITVIDHKLWYHAMRKYINTENGRSRQSARMTCESCSLGTAHFRPRQCPESRYWENAVASRKLSKDLFRGKMDAGWERRKIGAKKPTFIDALRRKLQVDKAALEKPDA
jgi:hypothetical protein